MEERKFKPGDLVVCYDPDRPRLNGKTAVVEDPAYQIALGVEYLNVAWKPPVVFESYGAKLTQRDGGYHERCFTLVESPVFQETSKPEPAREPDIWDRLMGRK